MEFDRNAKSASPTVLQNEGKYLLLTLDFMQRCSD